MVDLPNIQICAFADSDITEALDLWSSVAGISLTESDTPERISQFLERNPGFSAVARGSDNKIVGAVLCGHNGRAGALYHLAVSSSVRRKGIGSALVDFCFERLRVASISRCNIFVYNDNDEVNRFWLRNEWNDPATWRVLQKHVM